MARCATIPVIDLFAGPGGLGEGFSAFSAAGGSPFSIRLSIERDEFAHRTLSLRAFYRKLRETGDMRDYARRLRGEINTAELFGRHPQAARAAAAEAWHAELGGTSPSLQEMRQRVQEALGNHEQFVLIGGPPCQAYSLIGRSRNKGISGYRFDQDRRSTLYVEYLQFIADHWPSVFVMENVKGILSARLQGEAIFQRILADLHDPRHALRREGRSCLRSSPSHTYRLCALAPANLFNGTEAADFIVQAETLGIPQARHRVIIVGLRDDVRAELTRLDTAPLVSVEDVIGDLPPVRSGISRNGDGYQEWLQEIASICRPRLIAAIRKSGVDIADLVKRTVEVMASRSGRLTRGGEFVAGQPAIQFEREWFTTDSCGFCNHESRSHISGDLHRYLFAACFARARGRSPELADFPAELLPDHRNVPLALKGAYFADRFRVQRRERPSTTVTSHISKDGHYYIHYDPMQCRSLTVREAARLQTFPDSYIFEGPRTAQYVQVGNAVPPLLARQIAARVYEVLK